MDVMESPIEKPTRGQKKFFSGKQGKHTLKTLFCSSPKKWSGYLFRAW
jgi:hypothetical protein